MLKVYSQNNALHFDGVDDYVVCGSINPSSFTFEAWVNPGIVNKDQAILSTLKNEIPVSGMELHIASNGKPVLTVLNGLSWLDVFASTPIPANSWVHLAATFDGTNCKIYINGVDVTTGSSTAVCTAVPNTLNIGRRMSNGLFFQGSIDEVRVWNIARSATEIASNMNTSIANPATTSGLIAYYPFNQGTANGNNSGATTLTDVSASNMNGTLNNFALNGTVSNWIKSKPFAITSFAPTSGPVGTAVTITGSGFSTIAANNIVYFGALRATVSAASETSITVTVPSGAGSVLPLTVKVGNLVASSITSSTPKFVVTNTPNLELTYSTTYTLAGFYTPCYVNIADFNGDSKPDMAVLNGNWGPIDILLGNGNGTFTKATSIYTDNYARSMVVCSGDFNGDGNIDLVTANSGTNINTVSVFLGNGNGTFAARKDFPVNTPYSVTVGDFDGDGKADLATANYFAQTISVLKGNGDGTFAAKVDYSMGSNSYPNSIVVGEFNGDGISDIAVVKYANSLVGIFIGDGNGGFTPGADYVIGNSSNSVAIGDFNGDGKADLVTSNYGSNTVSILMGNGNGTFAAKVDYPAGNSPCSVSIGDFNGDGKLDLVIPNGLFEKTINILMGNGDGTFAAKITMDLGATPTFVAPGDFNCDGKTDMAVTFGQANSISVLTSVQSPKVTTQAVSDITTTSATGNGTVADFGTAPVTQHGVVWSTDPNPTIALATKAELGAKSTTGTFNYSITGLTHYTKYYVKAYATNAVGTKYGDEKSFTTLPPTPVVTSVEVPDDKYYKAGEALNFTVNFDLPVTVTGIPSLTIALNTGGNVGATYVSGSGTNSFVFKYTVAAGNNDDDGITIGAIALNGGTIQSAIGADADLTLKSVATTIGVKVDAVAPSQTSVDLPNSKTYIVGQDIDFPANFGENVIVETSLGIPYMQVMIGSTTVRANYVSGSGSKKIVFRYTVANNDYDADGIGVNLNIQLNGATFKDIAGNTAGFSPWPNMFFPLSTVKVDGVVPTITGAIASGNGMYVAGQSLMFTINFSKVVNVANGIPSLTLKQGDKNVNAPYVGGTGTTSLEFKYTVVNGDLASNGIVMPSTITLDGATIKDNPGNNATLTFTPPVTSGIKVDAVAPVISGIPTATSGNYTTGQNIDISIPYSENVVVTGSPYILLTIGSTTVQANYQSGSATNALVFRYTVTSTSYDADGITVGADIIGNGGYIKDEANNIASFTFSALTLSELFVNVIPATVTTQPVTSITGSSAVGNGNITSLGSVNPTQYGVVWSTTSNPTVALSTKTLQGEASATGAFTSSMTNLMPLTQYYVKAYVTNNGGTTYGDEVSFTTLDIIPNAPTDVEATADIAQATVRFTAPVSNGGSAIIGYTVTSSPDGKTATGTASPITITGLTNGTPYTFTVVATNSLGNSSPSLASAPVTPFVDTEKPVITGMPANITVSTDAGKDYATVTWTEPTATDNVGIVNFNANHAIGSQFAIGTTTVIYTATDAAGNTETASFTVTVTSATGIDPLSGTAIKVYPNPVTDVVNIITGNPSDNGFYNITSISGTIVARGAISNGQATANMDKLSSGIYIVRVQIGSIHTSHNIVKR